MKHVPEMAQVLSLSAENLPQLLPFPALRHPVLDLDHFDVVVESLRGFPNLETLAVLRISMRS